MPEGTVNIAGQVKGFDPTEYMDKRTVRKTDRFAQLVGGGGDAGGRRCRSRHRRRRGPYRLLDRHRHRRPEDAGDRPRQALRGRSRPAEPVLGDGADREHGRRRGVDGARHARPAHDRVHRLRRVGHVARERHPVHPRRAWPTRCSRAASRRRSCRWRWAGSARCGRCRGGWTTPRARAGRSTPAATASSCPRVSAVRGARGARAGPRPRRPHLRRGARLRHVERRPPRHRARPGRHESGPGDDDGDGRRRHHARPGRLRQRPRHVDAGRRLGRDAGAQARARRRARRAGADLVDQERDRPPARRDRRGRGGGDARSPCATGSCRRRST